MLKLKISTDNPNDASKTIKVNGGHCVTVAIQEQELEDRINPTVVNLDILNDAGERCRFFLSVHKKDNGRLQATLSRNYQYTDKSVRKTVTGAYWKD